MRRLPVIAGGGALMALAAGYLGYLHPAFDTVANFRWHLALLLAAATLLSAMLRQWISTLVFGAAATIGIATSLSGLPLQRFSPGPVEATGKVYQLLHFNLRFDNPRRADVIGRIKAIDADILSLSETGPLWEDDLAGLVPDYPHRFHCPEVSVLGGVMIFSKFPLGADNRYCHDYAALALVTVKIGERKLAIGSAHLRWPWPASGPAQVKALAPRLSRLANDALIAGDFNAATWTATTARFAGHGGLDRVTGIGGTWMYRLLPAAIAPFAGLPIDNIMHKGRVRVLAAETLEPIGSDHLPILVRFAIDNTASEAGG